MNQSTLNQRHITLRYFAWMREHIGTDCDDILLPDDTHTIADLLPHLRALSEGHALALSNMRVAVNRTYGDLDTPVSAGDEVAFFPPVTGG